eukprot:7958099-Pyramimonas_sp.AAC.1
MQQHCNTCVAVVLQFRCGFTNAAIQLQRTCNKTAAHVQLCCSFVAVSPTLQQNRNESTTVVTC